MYAFEPQLLEEGVRKHMLSVFVADERGLINRVAGVFARRGANIESLAVGLTVDKVRRAAQYGLHASLAVPADSSKAKGPAMPAGSAGAAGGLQQ